MENRQQQVGYYGRIESQKPARTMDYDFHKEAVLNTITALKEMETSLMRNIAESKREILKEIEYVFKQIGLRKKSINLIKSDKCSKES